MWKYRYGDDNIGGAGTLRREQFLVVEASSYQLDRIVDFRPDVALLLNITLTISVIMAHSRTTAQRSIKFLLNQNEKNVLIFERR